MSCQLVGLISQLQLGVGGPGGGWARSMCRVAAGACCRALLAGRAGDGSLQVAEISTSCRPLIIPAPQHLCAEPRARCGLPQHPGPPVRCVLCLLWSGGMPHGGRRAHTALLPLPRLVSAVLPSFWLLPYRPHPSLNATTPLAPCPPAVFDGFAGWDTEARFKIRVVCARPYHALFMHNMLIRCVVAERLGRAVWAGLPWPGHPAPPPAAWAGDVPQLLTGLAPCNRPLLVQAHRGRAARVWPPRLHHLQRWW